ATRWNPELRCAETYRDLQTPIEVMTADSTRNLTKFRLTPGQWKLNSEMCECLQVFLEPTLFFLRKEAAIIHEVVPTMSTLRYRLELMRDDVDRVLHPATRIAAQSSLSTLDKYMGIMGESDIYWMATVLCPWYKLEWCVAQGYPSNRTQDFQRMIYSQFAQTFPSLTDNT
ncbi:hypothetical protein BDV93DRAFT_423316, partial [Ceratobasidium sp. AG-I]